MPLAWTAHPPPPFPVIHPVASHICPHATWTPLNVSHPQTTIRKADPPFRSLPSYPSLLVIQPFPLHSTPHLQLYPLLQPIVTDIPDTYNRATAALCGNARPQRVHKSATSTFAVSKTMRTVIISPHVRTGKAMRAVPKMYDSPWHGLQLIHPRFSHIPTTPATPTTNKTKTIRSRRVPPSPSRVFIQTHNHVFASNEKTCSLIFPPSTSPNCTHQNGCARPRTTRSFSTAPPILHPHPRKDNVSKGAHKTERTKGAILAQVHTKRSIAMNAKKRTERRKKVFSDVTRHSSRRSHLH